MDVPGRQRLDRAPLQALDREAFDDRGYRIAETAEAAENPLGEMTEMTIMAGESEECAPKRPRSLSWSGDSRGELMMARHALHQNNLRASGVAFDAASADVPDAARRPRASFVDSPALGRS